MMICRVIGSIVCSCRIDGLKHTVFRLVESESGLQQAATDTVGAKPGDWVFLTTGTAARFATGDYEVLTDLAVCGVIDQWPPASAPN
jgi:ethanolamine utilization protein EutN